MRPSGVRRAAASFSNCEHRKTPNQSGSKALRSFDFDGLHLFVIREKRLKEPKKFLSACWSHAHLDVVSTLTERCKPFVVADNDDIAALEAEEKVNGNFGG